MQNWQCRWSPTLGGLEDTHQNVWGTWEYSNDHEPTVFFGIYGLPDFFTLWRHKGRKCILWAGTDIQHLLSGYWLDQEGKMKVSPFELAPWIDSYCENYVENEVEQQALRSVGIRSKVVPSFLGNIADFPVSFEPGNKVYTSVSGDNFELYGWDKIPELAIRNPNIEFHLYGNHYQAPDEIVQLANIFVHGRVPKEQMNEEIKTMQGALRLTEFDGFSEIIAKSLWMGQYPISLIDYPLLFKPDQIGQILKQTQPNHAARNYYLSIINNYPWNQK